MVEEKRGREGTNRSLGELAHLEITQRRFAQSAVSIKLTCHTSSRGGGGESTIRGGAWGKGGKAGTRGHRARTKAGGLLSKPHRAIIMRGGGGGGGGGRPESIRDGSSREKGPGEFMLEEGNEGQRKKEKLLERAELGSTKVPGDGPEPENEGPVMKKAAVYHIALVWTILLESRRKRAVGTGGRKRKDASLKGCRPHPRIMASGLYMTAICNAGSQGKEGGKGS